MSSAFFGPKLTDRRCRLLTGLTGGGAATDRVFRASKSKGKGSTVDDAANGVLMFRMRNGSGLTSGDRYRRSVRCSGFESYLRARCIRYGKRGREREKPVLSDAYFDRREKYGEAFQGHVIPISR